MPCRQQRVGRFQAGRSMALDVIHRALDNYVLRRIGRVGVVGQFGVAPMYLEEHGVVGNGHRDVDEVSAVVPLYAEGSLRKLTDVVYVSLYRLPTPEDEGPFGVSRPLQRGRVSRIAGSLPRPQEHWPRVELGRCLRTQEPYPDVRRSAARRLLEVDHAGTKLCDVDRLQRRAVRGVVQNHVGRAGYKINRHRDVKVLGFVHRHSVGGRAGSVTAGDVQTLSPKGKT